MHIEFKFNRTVEPQRLPKVNPRMHGPPTFKKFVMTKILRVPAIWDELHVRALRPERTNDAEWLADFERRILGRCHCRQQWRDDLKAVPVDFTRYFEWTVSVHNHVNARLGKPILTVDQARAIWSPALENQDSLNSSEHEKHRT